MFWDKTIFLTLNRLAGKSKSLDFLIVFCASFLPWLAAGFTVFLPTEYQVQILVTGVFGGLLALLAKQGILIFWQRPRPYLAIPATKKLVSTAHFEDLRSFPSSHALFFFAFFTVVFWNNPLFGAMLWLTGIATGTARVAGGVHWPSDILAGLLMGASAGFVTVISLAQFMVL